MLLCESELKEVRENEVEMWAGKQAASEEERAHGVPDIYSCLTLLPKPLFLT